MSRTACSFSLLVGLIVLALTRHGVNADVTLQLEITPISTTTTSIPKCSASFNKEFLSYVALVVVDATRQTTLLSDFTLTSDLQMTAVHDSLLLRRARGRGRRSVQELPLTTKSIQTKEFHDNTTELGHVKCSSSGCRNVCGTASCLHCSSGRRHALELTKGEKEWMGDAAEEDEVVDWKEVGEYVTSYATPLLQSYLMQHAGTSHGCLGNPDMLHVVVTFVNVGL